MKIPRDFDRWMFDYKEGNLSQSEIDYFEHFIAENPQYHNDVEAWDNSYINNQDFTYPNMDTLLKEKSYSRWMGWAASVAVLFVTLASLFTYFSQPKAEYSVRHLNSDEIFTFNYSLDNVDMVKGNVNQQNSSLTAYSNQSVNTSFNHSTIQYQNEQLQNVNQQQEDYLSRNNQNSGFNETKGNSISNSLLVHSNKKASHHNRLLNIELGKINDFNLKGNKAIYLSNPKFIAETKSNHKVRNKHSALAYKLKKLYRKIDRMTGYPIGLVNLHDPEILTPNSNLLTNNFGFTGSFGSARLEMKQRVQWMGSGNALEQSFINFDTYNKALKSGVGISLNRNSYNQGQFEDYNVNFLYSPKFQIGRKLFFEPAIKLTMGMLRMNSNKLNSNSKYEVERGRVIQTGTFGDNFSNANNLWYKDFGLGFLLNAEKFYVGFNADNLSKHKELIYGNNETSQIKINTIIGSDYQSKNKKMILSPFITYTQAGKLKEVWGGVNTKFYWLTVGGAYSSLGDYSASLGLKFRNFKLIYQYDKTTSFINNDRFASHNIGIRINAKQKLQR